ncbi:hypothetical protein GCM10009785_07970 [Brooklawnia cerclae]|uniref:PH domain-containing protein n=1 Tax=Brooklawnia cerclae TaxID=349934 RepID=A0ABX0SJ70_9ACTN|nr:hypothetical protein [Brooklawnia cerclae]NIH58374.1 hypothetical protein [Brooklawnia cerclae]
MDAAENPPARIDLGPTRYQLFDAFVWVGLGLVVGVFLALSTALTGEVNEGTVILGVGVVVLALASLVLEFRALPGAVVTVGDDEVALVPRRGDEVRFPRGQIGGIRLDPPVRDGGLASGRGPGVVDHPGSLRSTRAARRRRGLQRPTWRLTVLSATGSAMLADVGVGGNAERVEQLRRACEATGIRFASGE